TAVLLEDRKKPKAARRLKKIEKAEGEPGTVNEELRERLQQWRTEKFKAANAPAYTIMHQSTLMAIASIIPHTKADLLSVKGFGQAKFQKYGEEILEICKEF
ncbi:MAG: HRDC domain-containing protein, partial [Candidatus Cryptobacteroides sp.]